MQKRNELDLTTKIKYPDQSKTTYSLKKDRKNFVEIYENGNLLRRDYNLVVYSGRTLVMNILTGQVSNISLTAFGVGNGGGDPSNPAMLLNPQLTDTSLVSPLNIGPTYYGEGLYKAVTSIQAETTTSCIVTLTLSQTDLSSYGAVLYNELGLFCSAPLITNPSNFIMYARLTTLGNKTPTNSQTIVWYLFF